MSFFPSTIVGIPEHWASFDATDGGFKLVPLHKNSEEYQFVLRTFEATIPPTKHTIEKIERIQNELLWSRYYDCARRMDEHNNGVTNEKNLFHGTRTVNPQDIYKGDAGFDMRFSNNGMWGRGNYFAVNASYSNDYAHHANGSRQMMMANVLTGYQYKCQPDSTLRIPPVRDAGGAMTRRYDCVTGNTGGSDIFITYENDRAYPAYLIMYR